MCCCCVHSCADAKIPNVNANTLKVFMTYCKIPNYGSRTC